jgi:hypothetical protein
LLSCIPLDPASWSRCLVVHVGGATVLVGATLAGRVSPVVVAISSCVPLLAAPVRRAVPGAVVPFEPGASGDLILLSAIRVAGAWFFCICCAWCCLLLGWSLSQVFGPLMRPPFPAAACLHCAIGRSSEYLVRPICCSQSPVVKLWV